jgi:hypothetical protein
MAEDGGIGGRPMTPAYNAGLATSFYANPANRGKKVADLWATMPRFASWEDAARGDFSRVDNPAFAHLSDEGRTNLLRDVYGLSSEYKVSNGQLVRAKPHQGLVAGLALGAMVAPNLAGLLSAPGGAAAATGVGTATGTTAAAGGAGVAATGGFWSSPWLGPLIGAGTDLLGAGIASRAANRGTQAQLAQNAAAQQFLERTDARDFAEYMKERERGWRLQDEDRALERSRFDAREGRLTPYRELGAQGARTLASLLTVPQGGVLYHPPDRRNLAGLLKG